MQGIGPPITGWVLASCPSITNQENVLKAFLQSDYMEAFFKIEVPSSYDYSVCQADTGLLKKLLKHPNNPMKSKVLVLYA